MSSPHDVFLVLHPFRENVAEFQILLRPVADLGKHRLEGAEGFYDPTIDTALLVLRFPSELVDHWGVRVINLFASRCGLPMVVPSELSPSARRRFFLEHVSRYDTYVQQYFDPAETQPLPLRVLGALGEHVADMPPPGRGCYFDKSTLPLHGPRRPRRASTMA